MLTGTIKPNREQSLAYIVDRLHSVGRSRHLRAKSDLNRNITRGDNIKIHACIHCGSRNLRSGAAIDGVVPGDVPFVYICNDCEHKGAPIIFDSDEEYNKFQKALKE